MLNSCPNSIPCPGSDFPITNFSSEAPDVDRFIGINYGWDWNFPPLGSQWGSSGCKSICVSTLSQDDADLCAARQQLMCIAYPNGGGASSGSGTGTPSTAPWRVNNQTVPLFGNSLIQCSFTCLNGTVSAFLVLPNQFIARSQIQADNMAYSYACQQAAIRRICSGTIPDIYCLNQFSIVEIGATGGSPPFTFVVSSGSLPPGFVLSNDGVLFGTPTVAGDYSFTVAITNSIGTVAHETFNISILGITNTSLADGNVGDPYMEQLTALGGDAPYVFSVNPMLLPDGLAMNSSGLITGTPTTADVNTFTVIVTDDNGVSCNQDFSINVNESGPNWDDLVWDNQTFFGGASASGFALGASFSFDLTGTSSPAGSTSAFAEMHASLSYTGPAANCNLSINVQANGPVPATDGASAFIAVYQDSVQIAALSTANPPLGVTDIPFAVAPGTGSLLEVFVGIISDNIGNGWFVTPNGGHFKAVGTISNV